MQTAKTLMRLGRCPGWYESSLGAKVILLVLSWGGSYVDYVLLKANKTTTVSHTLKYLHLSDSNFLDSSIPLNTVQVILQVLQFHYSLSDILLVCMEALSWHGKERPEDQWSCIAHLIAEDMLKSTVIEEKKFKNIECKWFWPRSMTDLDLWYS